MNQIFRVHVSRRHHAHAVLNVVAPDRASAANLVDTLLDDPDAIYWDSTSVVQSVDQVIEIGREAPHEPSAERTNP